MKSFVKTMFFAAVFSVGLSLTPPASHAALTPATRVILDKAAEAGDQQAESLAALAELKKQPRADVLKAFRDGLSEGAPWTIVVSRAAVALDAKELLPEMLKAAEKDETWQLMSALERLSRGHVKRGAVEALFAKKLRTAPGSAKIVMIDAFTNGDSRLPNESFDLLINDRSPGVRQAVIRQFLATRDSYATEEQVRRFKLSFTVKPYQARLEAFETYASIPKAKRRSIASAFDPSMCATESNKTVKSVCDSIAKETK